MGICITRVVGPGTSGEFNPDGTLALWGLYTANHVVSKDAYVTFRNGCVPAFLCDLDYNAQLIGRISGTAQITVNGSATGAVSFSGALSSYVEAVNLCLKISTQYLHFAHLAPQGQSPTVANGLAGNNQISLVVSQATCVLHSVPQGNYSYDCTDDANGLTHSNHFAPLRSTSMPCAGHYDPRNQV